MGKKVEVKPGDVFGKYIVIEEQVIDGVPMVLCYDETKNTILIRRQYLITLNSPSRSRLYYVWANIKSRCHNINDKEYEHYGGRGIRVCDEWYNSFESFQKWALSNGYKLELMPNGVNKWSIDRINVDGNYCPENCRWVTIQEQLRNTTINKAVLHIETGKVYSCAGAAAEELSLNSHLIAQVCRGTRKSTGKQHFRYIN